jgi:hypothetical protein
MNSEDKKYLKQEIEYLMNMKEILKEKLNEIERLKVNYDKKVIILKNKSNYISDEIKGSLKEMKVFLIYI